MHGLKHTIWYSLTQTNNCPQGLGHGPGYTAAVAVCYIYLLLVYRKVIDSKSLKQKGKGQRGRSRVGVGGDRGIYIRKPRMRETAANKPKTEL